MVVFGANGLLGSNVIETAQGRDHDVRGTHHSTEPALPVPLKRLDITETEQVETYLSETDPDAVVNCAAMTDVDGCETELEQARAVNAEAPGNIARYCERTGIRFAHVSTDYVFEGTARSPYKESADPKPIQEYGRSKLAGEHAVFEAMTTPLVARLSFVWGVHRGDGKLRGFPSWVRDSLRAGDEVPLFTDQWVSPTRAGQAASVLLSLLEGSHDGTYHVASRSCVTPYEFGKQIKRHPKYSDGELTRSSTTSLDRPADRPAYSCLDVSRVEATRECRQPALSADLDAVDDYI